MPGMIIEIYIAPEAEAPMQSVREVHLEPGRGIVGDRYYHAEGTFSEELGDSQDYEVTLIESEQIKYFNNKTGLALDNGALRRNIVTTDIDLNALVGQQIHIGDVLLEGIRLCEPCSHLARLVAEQVLPTLVHRAGLRAKIKLGGIVRTGDLINVTA
jgi:MOSC domain-containing protein YiiM